MGRKLYAKGEGFNPSTSIEDVEGLREELDALKENGGGGGGGNTAIERRLTTAEGEIDDLQRDVAAVGAKANTLQGTDSGKSVRTIAAEETAKIVSNAPANYDTLKEIADYIATDATRAAELSNKVNKNATDIANLDSDKLGKTEKAADSAKADYATSSGSATNATNADSATKLATSRKIWGQNFNGSGDVDGDMEVNGDVVIKGNVVIEGNLTSGASYQSNPLSTISEGDVPSVEQQLRTEITTLEERIATLEQLIAQNNG